MSYWTSEIAAAKRAQETWPKWLKSRRTEAMPDEQQEDHGMVGDSRAPVTPETLRFKYPDADSVYHAPAPEIMADLYNAIRGWEKAAEALREAQERAEREKLGRLDAEGALWRVVPDTHSVPQQDPFEGPGETYRDAYDRLSTELEAQREITDRLAEENRRLREAGEHCLAVFQSQADRGRYPSELIPESEHFLGRQGWQFLTGALSTNPDEET